MKLMLPMALACFAITLAAASPAKKVAWTKPSSNSLLTYAVAPLDPASEDLGANYVGHSCRAVAKKVSLLATRKDEFETTSAYSARLKTIEGTTMFGTTKFADVVGFVPSSPLLSVAGDQYDADDQTMKMEAYLTDNSQIVLGNVFSAIKLDIKLAQKHSYTASNAYGKKVDVESTDWDTCALVFWNFSYQSSPDVAKISTYVHLTPDEAKDAKRNLALLYVGNLVSPYVTQFREHLDPTITSPTEATWRGDALVMNLVQVWFFNKQTGHVYKKFDIH